MTGLEDMMRTEYYTVLAPVNTGWEALPEGNLPFLQEPENEDLARSVVLNHIVDGLFPSFFLQHNDRLTTLNDGERHRVFIRFNDDETVTFRIGGEDVLAADGLANNGLGYAVAGVLLPDGIELPAELPSDMPSAMPSDAPVAVSSQAPSPAPNTGTDEPSMGSGPSVSVTTPPTDMPAADPTMAPTDGSHAATNGSFVWAAIATIVGLLAI